MKLTKKIISISAAVLAAGALSVSAFAANNAMNKAASAGWDEYSFNFNNSITRTTDPVYKPKNSGKWAMGTAEHGTFGINMPVTFYVVNNYGFDITKSPKTIYGVDSFSLEYTGDYEEKYVSLRGKAEGTYASSTIVSGEWKP